MACGVQGGGRAPCCLWHSALNHSPPLSAPPPPAGSTPTHALLLTGYDASRAGFEHFVAKNSLGGSWGERGMMRIAMTADASGMCGLYRAAVQPAAVTAVAPTKPGNGIGRV